jgi:hypothetical protein
MKAISLLIALFFVFTASSQSLERQVVASTGASTNNGIFLEYTIGEAVIGTFSNANAGLNQGFHQTGLNGIGINDFDALTGLTIFPNPVISELNVDFGNNQDANDYCLRLYSLTGVVLGEIKSGEAESCEKVVVLDVAMLPASGYVLQLINSKTGVVKSVLFQKVN